MKKGTKIIGLIVVVFLFLFAIYTTGCIGEENCEDCNGSCSGKCRNDTEEDLNKRDEGCTTLPWLIWRLKDEGQ